MSSLVLPFLAFTTTCLFIIAYKPLAEKVGLVDIPNQRKLHDGQIPLIGGISIFSAYFIVNLLTAELSSNNLIFMGCSFVLVTLGALDDYKDLSFKLRLVVQTIIALIMVYGADVKIDSLGNLFDSGEVELGKIAPFFTIIAVVGCINAFNMMDGIDGLCSGVTIITLLSITLYNNNPTSLTIGIYSIIFCLLAYMLFNLQPLNLKIPKIFMGDAGSMFIGFMIVWLLAETTQEDTNTPPIMAIWIIAIPLMDMGAIMLRRLKKGQSPFKPDRNHLHHIIMRAGFSAKGALIAILILATATSLLGYLLQKIGLSEWNLMLIWLTLFGIYSVGINHAWGLSKVIKKLS